jgi:hypothetical protein
MLDRERPQERAPLRVREPYEHAVLTRMGHTRPAQLAHDFLIS